MQVELSESGSKRLLVHVPEIHIGIRIAERSLRVCRHSLVKRRVLVPFPVSNRTALGFDGVDTVVVEGLAGFIQDYAAAYAIHVAGPRRFLVAGLYLLR